MGTKPLSVFQEGQWNILGTPLHKSPNWGHIFRVPWEKYRVPKFSPGLGKV